MNTASAALNITSAYALNRERLLRLLFMFTALCGALIFWLAPHPPMIDLPQHAAQVALLRDMLLGQSPWADLFHINVFTPYIIGYGLALPLSLIMPIAAAMKLLLSLAYIAFVFMCVKLRQHFGADARLDWLFLLSFFGLAYLWGYFTFLVAAPVGLLLILLSDRYAQRQTPARAASIILVGLILLISHGLVFLFATSIGLALLAAQVRGLKPLLRATSPFVILILGCGLDFLVNQEINSSMHMHFMRDNFWGEGFNRFFHMFIYSIAANSYGVTRYLLVPALIILVSLPWLMDLRIDWKNRSSWIPFATVSAVILCAPNFALHTAYIYQRYSIFLLPAYAWMFTKKTVVPVFGFIKPQSGAKFALPILVIICWAMLGMNAWRVWEFGRETADIDSLISLLSPKHRALGIALDQNGVANKYLPVYRHYATWYQAEKQGLVDYNFGWYPAGIVRYKPEHLPPVPPGFDEFPQSFDWTNNGGSNYTYFFVRHTKPIPQDLFKGAKCPPFLLITRGKWTVFERRTCS